MEAIQRITDFAEKIYFADLAKIKKSEAWEKYISPKFLGKFGRAYDPSLAGMYSGKFKIFLEKEDVNFKKKQ